MGYVFSVAAVAGILLLTGCAQNRASAPIGGSATVGHGQAAPVAAQLSTAFPAASRYATPAPAAGLTTARWVAIGGVNTTIYAEPSGDATPLAILRPGRAVPVLGRTGGDSLKAWCSIAWEGAQHAWTTCSSLFFIKDAPASLPVIAPAIAPTPSFQPPRTIVPATPAPTPVPYSNADVVRLLQQCQVTLYSTGIYANGVDLIDGTDGLIPLNSPPDDALKSLLATNRQRCGFDVVRAAE